MVTSVNNITWFTILCAEAEELEKIFNIKVLVEEATALEISKLISDTLPNIGIERPNVAKIAGQIAFWIRRLKPLRIDPSSPNYLVTLNEIAALRVGLAVCNIYKDDSAKTISSTPPRRILCDWINSFRYHSHSLHSSMISFELLVSAL